MSTVRARLRAEVRARRATILAAPSTDPELETALAEPEPALEELGVDIPSDEELVQRIRHALHVLGATAEAVAEHSAAQEELNEAAAELAARHEETHT